MGERDDSQVEPEVGPTERGALEPKPARRDVLGALGALAELPHCLGRRRLRRLNTKFADNVVQVIRIFCRYWNHTHCSVLQYESMLKHAFLHGTSLR